MDENALSFMNVMTHPKTKRGHSRFIAKTRSLKPPGRQILKKHQILRVFFGPRPSTAEEHFASHLAALLQHWKHQELPWRAS